MARPVSTHATTKFRLSKAVLADLEEMHWILRKGVSQIVEEAVVEYIAKNAPKSAK
jgi:hypothetical protein